MRSSIAAGSTILRAKTWCQKPKVGCWSGSLSRPRSAWRRPGRTGGPARTPAVYAAPWQAIGSRAAPQGTIARPSHHLTVALVQNPTAVDKRVFGPFATLQQRLPQELRLAGVDTVEAANRFLSERCVPEYNRRVAVAAAEPGSAFVPFIGSSAEIFCLQIERVVGNDNCVRYRRLTFQIPQQAHRYHFVKTPVRVHECADATLAVFDGPRCRARYR